MTKEDVQKLIVTLEVGQDVHLYVSDKKELYTIQYQIEQAKKFGYKILLKRLYGDKYYFEILEEGDRSRIERLIGKYERNNKPESEQADDDKERV